MQVKEGGLTVTLLELSDVLATVKRGEKRTDTIEMIGIITLIVREGRYIGLGSSGAEKHLDEEKRCCPDPKADHYLNYRSVLPR
ncbi:unnamed protein product [Bursaphelenchus xylophilus]|uniref:(pine wood nematode) hypothetical protein n=1 Tax=Bursaphelenchus xylophilus TaxID=6326 RepID=A0A1I7RQ48_BURXY|nr:unnamed protein product [Bursaphelenchus xylophilus]CAG9097153.1 unnamed protein product [Bursaphelenchus xylophilus]